MSLGPSKKRPKSYEDNDDSMLCKRVVTKDRRYITQITCYEKGKDGHTQVSDRSSGLSSSSRHPMRMPLFGKQGGGVLSSLFSKIGRQSPRQGTAAMKHKIIWDGVAFKPCLSVLGVVTLKLH